MINWLFLFFYFDIQHLFLVVFFISTAVFRVGVIVLNRKYVIILNAVEQSLYGQLMVKRNIDFIWVHVYVVIDVDSERLCYFFMGFGIVFVLGDAEDVINKIDECGGS